MKVSGSKQKWGWLGSLAAIVIGVALLILIEFALQRGWTTYTTANSGLTDNWVDAIAIDEQGRVWLGTERGVSVLDSDGTWTTYTEANSGLASDLVNAIAIDEQGRVWVGTLGGGLSMLDAGVALPPHIFKALVSLRTATRLTLALLVIGLIVWAIVQWCRRPAGACPGSNASTHISSR